MADKKIIFNLFSLFVFLVLTVSIVSALGVTPTKKIVDFEERLNFDSEFKVVNTLNSTINVGIEITGELSEYLMLEDGSNYNLDANSEKIVKYSFNLPDEIKKNDVSQGNNDIQFNVRELTTSMENTIGTSIGLISLLRIKVPYDSKYVSSSLYIHGGDEGANTIFVIPIENLGTDNISDANVVLNILEKDNVVEKLKSKSISIESGERKEIRIVWPTEISAGDYLIGGILEYDSKIYEFEKEFVVEGKKLSIGNLVVGEILGDAVRFEVTVKNVWNEELSNVYAEIGVYDLNNSLIGSFITSKESISKRDEGIFAGHIDVGNLTEGEYSTKLTIHYGNNEVEQNAETTFYENKFIVEGAKAESGEGNIGKLSLILTSFLVCMIVINLVWMHWFKKRD